MDESKYVVITPARNESDHIERTLSSMVGQTVLPLLWVVVDDGSTDGTANILKKYIEEYSWIKLVRRDDRGFRKQGGGVVEAFYEGYPLVARLQWDYIVKLDGDMSFGLDYFQRVLEYFGKEPDLGIAGGLVLNSDSVTESHDPTFHVRGATKIYRRSCWEDIEPLERAPGWDSLDELKANMRGWKTRTLREIPILHHRSTGAADGAWKNWMKNGRANYVSGYHPLFMLFKSLKYLLKKPYCIASLGLMWGFISGYLTGVDQAADHDLIKYIRKEQIKRLTFRQSIWSGN